MKQRNWPNIIVYISEDREEANRLIETCQIDEEAGTLFSETDPGQSRSQNQGHRISLLNDDQKRVIAMGIYKNYL